MGGQQIKPGRLYYILGIAVIAAGAGLFTLFFFTTLEGLTESLMRVVVPCCEVDATLSETGRYTIFYEYQSVVGSKVYSTEQRFPYHGIKIASEDTETMLEVSKPMMNYGYSVQGRSGVAVADFIVDQSGAYEIYFFSPEARVLPEIVLAIGHGFQTKLMGIILTGLGMFCGFAAAGITVLVVTFLRRRKKTI